MFFFKKKNTTETDLSWVGTDIHSHLIPGIDDGAQNMEASMELIKGMANFGYKKLITTPHILWELYPNTPEIIRSGLNNVRDKIKEKGLAIEIEAGAEYFMDEHLEQLLEKRSRLLTIKGNMVLVEFSMVTIPMDLKKILFELQIQNYEPILAHPERYVYFERQKEFFTELKTFGCLFQLNMLSLTGYYGPSVQELAEYLVKNNFYDFVGSDLHNERHLEALKKVSLSGYFKKLKDSGRIRNMQL